MTSFVPTPKQQKLMDEFEEKYGPPNTPLTGGVENTDHEYVKMFNKLKQAGVMPSKHGWVRAAYKAGQQKTK